MPTLAEKARQTWPRLKVEEGLKRGFKSIIVIGQDDSHTIYDIADRDYRFVVALVHEGGAKAGVSELGFLARFVGFHPSDPVLRKLNSALHLADAFIEDGDLYVLAKIAVQKRFSEGKFALILGAWKRDMTFALDALHHDPKTQSRHDAEVLGFEPAQIEAHTAAFCKRYFWRNEPMIACPACAGKGRSGFIARECATCDGRGFVDPTR